MGSSPIFRIQPKYRKPYKIEDSGIFLYLEIVYNRHRKTFDKGDLRGESSKGVRGGCFYVGKAGFDENVRKRKLQREDGVIGAGTGKIAEGM